MSSTVTAQGVRGARRALQAHKLQPFETVLIEGSIEKDHPRERIAAFAEDHGVHAGHVFGPASLHEVLEQTLP